MDDMTGWKSSTTLAELAPDDKILLRPKNAPAIWATPRELVQEGRLPSFLTIDQVEFTLSKA